jgi:UDPglucose--hexose-1-phosphate uridylyltransferase
MPEFRQEPLSGRWVIIAEDRAARPSEFVSQPTRRAKERCPFCAGNEEETPDAVAIYPAGATWQVRVIPNKYPAAVPPGDTCSKEMNCEGDRRVASDLSQSMAPASCVARAGVGVHEVIIESPRHVASFSELTDEQAHCSFLAYRDRLRMASHNSQLAYGLVFKNCRGGGGATLEHVHSQLLATSIVPNEVEQELRSTSRHFEQRQQCLVCSLLDEELSARARIVAETSRFVAYCPFASRFPYETWIVPRQHLSRFESAATNLFAELTQLVRAHVDSLEHLFPDVAYNYWIHTAPFHVACEDYFHWRIVLIPRVTTQAGYEWATGSFVNPVAPESAARKLREG